MIALQFGCFLVPKMEHTVERKVRTLKGAKSACRQSVRALVVGRPNMEDRAINRTEQDLLNLLELRHSPCTVCGAVLRTEEILCHVCTYGGLEPPTYAKFFWDEV